MRRRPLGVTRRRPARAARPVHQQLALPFLPVPGVCVGRLATVPDRTARRLRPQRGRCGDVALDTGAGLLVDLVATPVAASTLPRGLAAGRYRCLACGLPLELCGPRTDPGFTARFRHLHRCAAPADHRALVRAAIAAVRARGARPPLVIGPSQAGQPTTEAAAETPRPHTVLPLDTASRGHRRRAGQVATGSWRGIRRAARRLVVTVLGPWR